jgi:hypothetical protein
MSNLRSGLRQQQQSFSECLLFFQNLILLQRHQCRGRKKPVVEAEGLFLQLLSLHPTQLVKKETTMTKLMQCRILRLLSPSVSWTFFRRPSWKGFSNAVSGVLQRIVCT